MSYCCRWLSRCHLAHRSDVCEGGKKQKMIPSYFTLAARRMKKKKKKKKNRIK